jgi:hypothetical protein
MNLTRKVKYKVEYKAVYAILRAAALASTGLLFGATMAHSDTLFIEAEGGGHDGHPLSNDDAKITSPLLVKDDDAASLGRYLTVASGFNSQSGAPAVEGVATYRFRVDQAGTYRVWGRVIAPTTGDDSFWVRMRKVGATSSTLVEWNGITPGAAWHWALVKAEGAASAASFTLESSVDYELQVSYREDGTKLDLLVVTNDGSFNPLAPPTTAPPLPPDTFDAPLVVPRSLSAGAATGIKVFWSEVPGAKSYTLHRFVDGTPLPTITGLTTHAFKETTLPPPDSSNCYDVTAVFPDGSFREFPSGNPVCDGLRYQQTFLDTSGTITGSAPMVSDRENNSAYTAAGTPSSESAPPAHGRLRFDFEVGGSAKLQLWFVVDAADKDHDSFWARMDEGTWIKWNNIPNGECSPVSNSDADDHRVTFNVAAGTHRFELATRETGVVGGVPQPALSNILFITDDLAATWRLCQD